MFARAWRWLKARASVAPRQRIGMRGEEFAAGYLRGQGWQIIARNVRSRFGELDIVAADGNCLVFVEVKTRSTTERGEGYEAVDRRKQCQIARAAAAYLRQRPHEGSIRFDVLSLTWPDGAREPKIRHFRGAFEALEVVD